MAQPCPYLPRTALKASTGTASTGDVPPPAAGLADRPGSPVQAPAAGQSLPADLRRHPVLPHLHARHRQLRHGVAAAFGGTAHEQAAAPAASDGELVVCAAAGVGKAHCAAPVVVKPGGQDGGGKAQGGLYGTPRASMCRQKVVVAAAATNMACLTGMTAAAQPERQQ